MVLPAPLRPTMATISPARTDRRDAAQDRRASGVVVVEDDVAEFDARARTAASVCAPGRSCTSVCVSSISKIRSDAAIVCCRLAFTRLSFLTGPYISNSAATNDVNSPGVSRAARDGRGPRTTARPPCHPAQQLHHRRQDRQRRRHLHVRAVQPLRRRRELVRLVLLGAERLDDAVAGERLGADVREVLQRLLAAARRLAKPLPEPGERVDDQRSAGQEDERQPRVVVEEEAGVADERERLAQEVAHRLRDRAAGPARRRW